VGPPRATAQKIGGRIPETWNVSADWPAALSIASAVVASGRPLRTTAERGHLLAPKPSVRVKTANRVFGWAAGWWRIIQRAAGEPSCPPASPNHAASTVFALEPSQGRARKLSRPLSASMPAGLRAALLGAHRIDGCDGIQCQPRASAGKSRPRATIFGGFVQTPRSSSRGSTDSSISFTVPSWRTLM